jgi:hypothetical protein
MGLRTPTTRVGALALAALAAALMAATAVAGVTVYKNNFSSKVESKELRHVEGKHCSKTWREKGKSALISTDKGPRVCGYAPPVEGDTGGPDQTIQAKEKLLKDTPKSARDGVYLAVAVHSGKETGYVLRIYPTKHKFKLIRRPSGGGKGFPVGGRSKAIQGVNKPNVLSLKAVGTKVIARVNGKKLVKSKDTNPAQVDGRKLEVALGYDKKKSKPALITVDDVSVQVPKP